MERTTVSIKLEGMTELVAAMRRLPIAVRGEVLEHAVKMGAQVVGQAVSERASGAFRSRTGKLLRAIRQGLSLASRSLIRTLARSPEYVLVEVWPKLPYTHLVVGGHRIIARGPGRKAAARGRGRRAELRRSLLSRRAQGARGLVAPRDFMGSAYDATKDEAVERILNELWRGIERAWIGGN